ncbi:hypothetical protein [Bacillus sp. S3]|uniref:hypothetical protein n=1 Tax=Bacillus sp. S3 TaxID=486398 RepID=UPI001680A5C2|nr:hypothetical protein [Bacillus sp. S3]
MNQTLSTFLKIAVTVISISAFLFVLGYNMVNSEATAYKTKVTGIQANMPKDK